MDTKAYKVMWGK